METAHYLSVIKGRSDNTIKEYRTDVLTFLTWLMAAHDIPLEEKDYAFADADFIKSITLNEMYAFCHNIRKSGRLDVSQVSKDVLIVIGGLPSIRSGQIT